MFGLDIFGRKAARRAKHFADLATQIADAPAWAYRNIERGLAATLQNDFTPIFGRRYTPIWYGAVAQERALLAVAARAVRIQQIAKLQADIAFIEETLAQVAAGEKIAPWANPNYLQELKEQLQAAKYGPLTWVPEWPDLPHPTDRPLTSAQIAAAKQELDRRCYSPAPRQSR